MTKGDSSQPIVRTMQKPKTAEICVPGVRGNATINFPTQLSEQSYPPTSLNQFESNRQLVVQSSKKVMSLPPLSSRWLALLDQLIKLIQAIWEITIHLIPHINKLH